MAVKNMFKFIDPVYRGLYHGSQKHKGDLHDVLRRAWDTGVERIFITGGSLDDSKAALDLAKTHERLFCTVGCHPTRCQDFEASESPQQYLQELTNLAQDNRDKVVAIGECGLDYDRLNFCPKDIQQKYFEWQFEVAECTQLPMFLHCRNAASDMNTLLTKHRDRIVGGVVHSFTGSAAEANSFVDLGFYIGINGCSLKTQENIDAMCSIPSERLMLETDAPWCDIRPTHAGHKYVKTVFTSRKKERWEEGCMVKSRNEPCSVLNVLEVMAGAREEDISQLAAVIFENTRKLFGQVLNLS